MLLRALLDHPQLDLTVLHPTEALDQPFSSVFTTDLRDPQPYITSGALVLTGLMWRRGPADSETFVAALANAGAAAVAAGEAALGEIPADLVDACQRHELCLLSVPVTVSFSQISDVVARTHEEQRQHALVTALDRQRRLLSAMAEGRTLDDVLALVADVTGVGCQLLSASGRTIAGPSGSLSPPGPADVNLLCRRFLTADRLPTVTETPGTGQISIVPAVVHGQAGVDGWFLTCTGDHARWSDDIQITVNELASMVALELQRREGARADRQHIADDVLELIATGRTANAELSAHLADLDTDPAGPFLLTAARCLTPGSRAGLAHAVLHESATHVTPAPVTGLRAGTALALLPGADGTAERLNTAIHRLAPAMRRHRVAVGVANAADLATVSGALDGAMHALDLAAAAPAQRDAPVSVLVLDEIDSHMTLLAAVPEAVRRAYATRLLKPVLDHDVRYGTQLRTTLDTFLRSGGSWSSCARTMHIHVNTVRYRIQRIEQLTGRDLSLLSTRVDLVLALEIDRHRA